MDVKKLRKLFVGGLPQEMTEKELREFFGSFGTVADAVIIKDKHSKKSRGFGFVSFKDKPSMKKVLKEPVEYKGKVLEIKVAEPKKPSKLQEVSDISSITKVFVGGVPKDATIDDLREAFLKYGELQEASLVEDKKTNEPRGFGFVTFKDVEVTKKVIEDYNLHKVCGKWVECKIALPKSVSEPYNLASSSSSDSVASMKNQSCNLAGCNPRDSCDFKLPSGPSTPLNSTIHPATPHGFSIQSVRAWEDVDRTEIKSQIAKPNPVWSTKNKKPSAHAKGFETNYSYTPDFSDHHQPMIQSSCGSSQHPTRPLYNQSPVYQGQLSSKASFDYIQRSEELFASSPQHRHYVDPYMQQPQSSLHPYAPEVQSVSRKVQTYGYNPSHNQDLSWAGQPSLQPIAYNSPLAPEYNYPRGHNPTHLQPNRYIEDRHFNPQPTGLESRTSGQRNLSNNQYNQYSILDGQSGPVKTQYNYPQHPGWQNEGNNNTGLTGDRFSSAIQAYPEQPYATPSSPGRQSAGSMFHDRHPGSHRGFVSHSDKFNNSKTNSTAMEREVIIPKTRQPHNVKKSKKCELEDISQGSLQSKSGAEGLENSDHHSISDLGEKKPANTSKPSELTSKLNQVLLSSFVLIGFKAPSKPTTNRNLTSESQSIDD